MIFDQESLVDLKRRRRQLFAGDISRADILTAIAHDAGETVKDVRPVQILQASGAKLFDCVVFEIKRRQLAQGTPPWTRQKVQWRHEKMGVFALGEIRQEISMPPRAIHQKR